MLEIELLEQWYINYLNLCKKYNMRPLSGEAGSGAFSHFRDLLLRDTDYIEFLSTIFLKFSSFLFLIFKESFL